MLQNLDIEHKRNSERFKNENEDIEVFWGKQKQYISIRN